MGDLKLMPLTVVLIALCIVFALLSNLGSNIEVLKPFFISLYGSGLPEVQSGELWRLLTPIFIHFGIIHVLFNTLWLYDLGGVIEQRQGSPRLGLLVAVTGVGGNMAQYLWAGPAFGGMSGVVYGLLGYIWVLGMRDPRAGLALHQPIVIMMLVWFVLCWTGLVGNVANMAHTAGLMGGLVLGWLFTLRRR